MTVCLRDSYDFTKHLDYSTCKLLTKITKQHFDNMAFSVRNPTNANRHLLLSFDHNGIRERRRRSADFKKNFVFLQKRPKNEEHKVLPVSALRNALKKVAICMHYLANFG